MEPDHRGTAEVACYFNVGPGNNRFVSSLWHQRWAKYRRDPSNPFKFPAVSIFDSVWVTLWPLPYGGLSNSKSRLHYWAGHSEWLLLTSCCSSLTPFCERACCVCLCVYADVYLCICVCACACVRDPEWLVSNKEMKSIVGFFFSPPQRTIFFYYFTCTSLSHWVCSHAATNSPTSIGSIYLVDRSAEWLLLLSRPHKNHSN